nr:uncharacterized protein LOC128680852 [Plodia interpunctella]
MRAYVLITLLFVAQASATFDFQTFKENLARKLHILEDKAENSLRQLIRDNIDVERIKQRDFLHIIPFVASSADFIKEKLENLPTIIQTGSDSLRSYYHKLHSLTGKDLHSAFVAGVPWPVLRRKDEFDD